MLVLRWKMAQSGRGAAKNGETIQTQINDERYSSYQHTNSLYPCVCRLYSHIWRKDHPLWAVIRYWMLFDANFSRDSRIVAFGEDVGKIEDNESGICRFAGEVWKKRIYDTGIREASIMGEGIGVAMRGLRPLPGYNTWITLYGLQPLADDLACLSYRKGGQKPYWLCAPRDASTGGYLAYRIAHGND